MRIAENGVMRFIGGGETMSSAFTALCAEHAVPEERLSELRVLAHRIAESATMQMSHGEGADPGAMLQQSLRHKEMVDRHRKVLKDLLKAVPTFRVSQRRWGGLCERVSLAADRPTILE